MQLAVCTETSVYRVAYDDDDLNGGDVCWDHKCSTKSARQRNLTWTLLKLNESTQKGRSSCSVPQQRTLALVEKLYTKKEIMSK